MLIIQRIPPSVNLTFCNLTDRIKFLEPSVIMSPATKVLSNQFYATATFFYKTPNPVTLSTESSSTEEESWLSLLPTERFSVVWGGGSSPCVSFIIFCLCSGIASGQHAPSAFLPRCSTRILPWQYICLKAVCSFYQGKCCL